MPACRLVVRFLSDEWLAAAAELTAAGAGNSVVCVVEQVVHNGDHQVRYQVHVSEGAARVDPRTAAAADVEIVEDYDVAVAISRGELDPGTALARGSITVRGDAGRLAAAADSLARMSDVLAPLRDRTEY